MNLSEADREFEALLDYLKRGRGCDLTAYKRSTLIRRLAYRMQALNIESYRNYLHYLQNHPDEDVALLETLLINVTGFFRDRDSWDYLAEEIIPNLVASKQPDAPIRVWSAACASGQEAYSLVILLAEALGLESCLQRVRCYGTDMDEEALKKARSATYQPKEATDIPPDLLEKYFTSSDRGYVFHPQLRRAIIFGRHNLAEDAPLSQIDLLACRNALIYFNAEMQTTILARFHFALKNNGFLFLGKTETLMTQRPIFTLTSLKHRVFVKGLKLSLEEHLQIRPRSRKKIAEDNCATSVRIWKTAFEKSPFAQFAADTNNCLVMANERANSLFGLSLEDLGHPLQNLKVGQLLDLDTALQQVNRDRRPVTLNRVAWKTASGTTYFDIFIVPVFTSDGHLLGANVMSIEENYSRSQHL